MSENPDIRELYEIIKQLKKRIEILENEKEHPKGKTNQILKVLKERSPPYTIFSEWLNNILDKIENYLDCVFNNDLLYAIKKLLNDSLYDKDNIPIIILNKKPNIFYYYNDDNEWVLLENTDFDIKISNRIAYRFLYEFNRLWYEKNIQKIRETEEYNNLYNDYYLKILGGNRMSDDSRNQKIRKHFNQILK